MKIHTHGGLLPIEVFNFPDGQPHLKIRRDEWVAATIEAAITSPMDLFQVLLAKNTLDAQGCITSLDIRYLMGARMDRRIASDQPATLEVVGQMIQQAGFRRVRVYDPHSVATLIALDATAVQPLGPVKKVLEQYHPSHTVLVAPDAGATPRVRGILQALGCEDTWRVVQGVKHRDSATGNLSGFGVEDASVVNNKVCLIVDDLCDGGGTFTGLAMKLREAGAVTVDLYVTHGIFSKGMPLSGIRNIFTTDTWPNQPWDGATRTIPVVMSDCD